jgi:translocation and assembly module TamA
MSPRRVLAVPFALLAGPAAAAVDVIGIEGPLLENVVQYLGDRPACEADEPTVRRYAEDLPQRLQPAFDAFGYYRAQIMVRLEPRAPDCWQLQVEVEQGERVLVRELSLRSLGEGRDDAALQALLDAFPLRKGGPLRHDAYQSFKSGLEELALERGYLEARFTEERLDVYVDESAADIALEFDSGPRSSFGDVSFSAAALSDRVLESFLPFMEGQPYDASLIAELQRELGASQYFSTVRVVPQLDAARDRRIPIRIEAVAAEPTTYSVGTGFSTDDGPRFRFFYANRRRNRAGHQMEADLLLSAVRQNATFDYRVPVGNPQRDWLSWKIGLAREDIDAGVSAAGRLGVRRTQVGDALTVTRFVDVLLEQDDVAERQFTTGLLIPGISWARSYRDDFVRPREGHRLGLGVSLGVGSDVSLLQVDLRGKWITAMWRDARLLIRGRVGATLEHGDFANVPLSLRFFAGGDNSVRGYDYESLGPRNAAGDLIGGNRLLEASVEYEHPVRDAWSVAAFVDAGNAFLGSDFDARTGVGIGARWFSPIGPVRLDIAWPLHGDDRSPELHISLGPDL